MLQSAETTFVPTDSTRRRSTFYVPLVSDLDCPSAETLSTNLDEIKKSIDQLYNPDLSACSFEWSLDDSLSNADIPMSITTRIPNEKTKRYGIVLNGIDLDDESCQNSPSNTSTPIKVTRSHSRSNLLSSLPDATTPTKEKSKTLPQNLSPASLAANTFPPKHSFLLKSTPKISLNYSSSSEVTTTTPSPKKSLSFIRRAHSTKLSRNNSLLKSLTSKCVDQSVESLCRVMVNELQLDRLEKFFKADNCSDLVRDMFFKEKPCGQLEDSDVHSGIFFLICSSFHQIDFI